VAKEQHSRDKLEASGHLLIKARNPCQGELTVRGDDAELLLKITLAEMGGTRNLRSTVLEQSSSSPVSSPPVDGKKNTLEARRAMNQSGIGSIKTLKQKVDDELAGMKKAAAYNEWALQRMPPGQR
jgi:hypothetical protein